MVRDFGSIYAEVLRRLVDGRTSEAAGLIQAVPNWRALPASRHSARAAPIGTQMRVFRRDSFICRYCGRRTVLPPVLRLLSIALCDVFPYHPHGKMSRCHLAFWRDIASCDHLTPLARFGTSDEQNLVTACYMCNSIKQHWTIEELRWEVRAIPESGAWDGLSGGYGTLLDFCEPRFAAARIPYFRNWLRASKAASSDEPRAHFASG